MLRLTQKVKPILLCILDGWGIAAEGPGNAITQALPYNFNSLWHSFPHTYLTTTGQAVGLPQGTVGNSEVGHQNLGAGKIVFQDLLRINTSIADGTFFENQVLLDAVEHIKKNNSKIHLIGLVGLGSVHSDNGHVFALLAFLKKEGIPSSKINLHLFTDGRDSPPTSAKIYLSQITEKLRNEDLGHIASISGRYYAMDRDNRWDRTQKAYMALIGNSKEKAQDVIKLIDESYLKNETDEFITPTIISDTNGNPVGPIVEGDSVIFFNFRPDRARQLTKSFVLEELGKIKTTSGEIVQTFQRGPKIKNLFFATFTQYEKDLPVSGVVFEKNKVVMPIARVFSERGGRQFHIAETEKYAHVTYFFNGGNETPFVGEDRMLINSPKVASYDQKPEMSAEEITRNTISKINERVYDFIVLNFANADMVAHTGNIEATVEAVKTIDKCLNLLFQVVNSKGGALIITADHGNAEELINPTTGAKDTEHNASPAPLIIATKEFMGKSVQLPYGLLADVAPTILGMLNIPKPSQMTGRNLLE